MSGDRGAGAWEPAGRWGLAGGGNGGAGGGWRGREGGDLGAGGVWAGREAGDLRADGGWSRSSPRPFRGVVSHRNRTPAVAPGEEGVEGWGAAPVRGVPGDHVVR